MKILWFTWKDKKNPLAGGAEIVNEELAKRLVEDGHEVVLLVGGFDNSQKEETIDGYKIIRVGGRWTVYLEAYKYYKNHLKGWADFVIDEVNTIPFFCKFYVKEKNIILSYQLCREIWFYQMFFPLNIVGYLIEPLYLYLLKNKYVLTESESTKEDYQRFGFNKDKIFVFPVGLESNPISKNELDSQIKETDPTILYVGSIRDMKRPDHVLKAFEIAKNDIKNLKLHIVGGGKSKYADSFYKSINQSKYANDIKYFGRVDNKEKLEIMKKSHVICVTSVKEGWGLIVTEANSYGTPAITYNTDGLRDSCKNNFTGLVTDNNNPMELSKKIVQIFNNNGKYKELRENAWLDSFNYNYDNSYIIFKKYIDKIYKNL